MDKWNTTPPTEDGAYICSFNDGAWDEKRVIAWMPMPDIYTEE